jgi:hypothetical protein
MSGAFDRITITKAEMEEISCKAMKLKTKADGFAPKVIRVFLEHITRVYGLDLNIETEDMADERLEAESKELARKDRKIRGMAGKPSRNRTTRF